MSTTCPVCFKPATSPLRKCFGQVASVYCANCNSCLHVPAKANIKNIIYALLVFWVGYIFTGSIWMSSTIPFTLILYLTYKEKYVSFSS